MAKGKAKKAGDPPFETVELRRELKGFFDQKVEDPVTNAMVKVGNYKWGVYLFYDYDGEPIYVGQSKESLRSRIGRHLTNQRTDAVAMSVLDPFEVRTIRVWPLPQYQKTSTKDKDACEHLNALESLVHSTAIAASRYGVILNEKNPPESSMSITLPNHVDGSIVSEAVLAIRGHADTRLARRALILSRLSQVIAEREVQGGLRRVQIAQAKRLRSLAQMRYEELGGESSVVVKSEDDDENGDAEE